MKIRFLGTGTSTGVPEVGCRCAVCTSADSRDARMRTSVLVDYCGKRLLLDCGPDFRTQMMKVDFRKIDGVLLSHEHYDHVGGLDDLRPFCRFGNVDIYCEPSVASALRQRIPYCFAASPYPGVPKIVLHEISTSIPFQIAGIDIEAVRVWHGKMPIAGYRIGRMAYLTDLSRIDDSELSKLADIELLIIDALRIKPHGSHENLEEALENIKRINARQNYLIHMSHDIGLHQEVAATLPPNTHISYDGLEIELPDGKRSDSPPALLIRRITAHTPPKGRISPPSPRDIGNLRHRHCAGRIRLGGSSACKHIKSNPTLPEHDFDNFVKTLYLLTLRRLLKKCILLCLVITFSRKKQHNEKGLASKQGSQPSIFIECRRFSRQQLIINMSSSVCREKNTVCLFRLDNILSKGELWKASLKVIVCQRGWGKMNYLISFVIHCDLRRPRGPLSIFLCHRKQDNYIARKRI